MFETVPDVDFGLSSSMLDLQYDSYSLGGSMMPSVPEDLLACAPIGHGWSTPPDSPVHSSEGNMKLDGLPDLDAQLDLAIVSEKLANTFETAYDWSSRASSPEFMASEPWITPPASPVDCSAELCQDIAGMPSAGTTMACDHLMTAFAAFPAECELGMPAMAATANASAAAARTAPSKRKSPKASSASAKYAKDAESRRRSLAKRIAEREVRTAECDRAVEGLPQGKMDLEDPEMRRHCHNVLERKRRNDLKNSYQLLHEALPSLQDRERAPTGQILLHAVDHVQELKDQETSVLSAIAAAKAENRRLKMLLGHPL